MPEVGHKADRVENLLHRTTVEDHALAETVDVFPLFGSPQLGGHRLHAAVGLRITRKARGAHRGGSQHHGTVVHELHHPLQHLGTHRLLPRQHQHAVLRAVGKRQQAVAHRSVTAQHLGVDVIELVARRQRRVAHARHLRHVLTDEIGRIGHVQPLLEHEVTAFEIGDEEVQLVEPRVVAVELVAEEGVHTGFRAVGRLRNVDMQQRVVDALREEAVAALLHPVGMARIGRKSRRERFGRNLILAVNMGAGGCGTVLDIAQLALAPVLPGHLVRLAAVLQKLAREAPVSVIFEPCGETVAVSQFPQGADMVVRQPVGHHPPQVPQETVRTVAVADRQAAEHGQVGMRVVAVTGLERLEKIVAEVLAALLVTVGHDDFPRLAVGGGNATAQLPDESVVMLRQMRRAPFVHLQPCSVLQGGTVHHPGRHHARAQDHPTSGRSLPAKTVTGETIADVNDRFRCDGGRRVLRGGLAIPHIVVPVRQRRLVHLGQRFFGITFHERQGRKFHLGQTAVRRSTAHHQPENVGFGRLAGDRNGGVGIESHLRGGIRAVDDEAAQYGRTTVFYRLQLRGNGKRHMGRIDSY